MLAVGYRCTIGSWSVDSRKDPHTEIVGLDVRRSSLAPIDACRVSLYLAPPARSGLLQEAAGAAAGTVSGAIGGASSGASEPAFSVDVRGNAIKDGDPIVVELVAGDLEATVFTGEVQHVISDLRHTTVVGTTGVHKLASTRLNGTYDNKSLGQIVKDLAGQCGVTIGIVEDGSQYSYFLADESKPCLDIIRGLAMRDNLDCYFDSDNKLTIKRYEKAKPDHSLHYGIDILDVEQFAMGAWGQGVRVYSESPSSNQGTDTWHWLVKDNAPYLAELGDGARRLAIQDGAVRTKASADGLATAKYGAIRDRATRARIKTLGNPKIGLGDAIEINQVPKPELNGLFKVTAVRHLFSKRGGYVTLVDVSGQGGAAAASGLLGAAGAVTGALGL